MKTLRNIKGIIYVLLAGCMWGCMGLLVRPLNKLGLETMDIVALRAFETVVLTFITFPTLCKLTHTTNTEQSSGLTEKTDGSGFWKNVKNSILIKPGDIWVFIGTGIVSVVFFNYCYFNTIIYTSLSVAAIMLYTAPIFVMLISAVVFKDSLTKRKVIALILAFAGCGIVTGAFTGELVLDGKGILFGFGAGIGYALYSIFGKLAADRGYNSVTITLYTFLFASIGVLPFIRISHIIEVFRQNGGLTYTFVLIVITTFLPYIFYTAGLSEMEPGKAAIIACIEPVMATVIGMLAFGEMLTAITIVGVLLVIIAIIIINAKSKQAMV